MTHQDCPEEPELGRDLWSGLKSSAGLAHDRCHGQRTLIMSHSPFDIAGVSFHLLLGLCLLLAACESDQGEILFRVNLSETLTDQPVSGRLFLALSPEPEPEPRIAAYTSARRRNGQVPFFAVDISELEPGGVAVLDHSALGYPYSNLHSLPAGHYYAQALVHVYTRFERSDGHVIWAPQDQWDGQRWGFSPGNLVSDVLEVTIAGDGSDQTFDLSLNRKLPEIDLPGDTEWVKHIKIQSDLLSKFWGRPIYLGATILLPSSYSREPDRHYPVVYQMSHFDLDPPFDFSPEPAPPASFSRSLDWRPEIEADWLWTLGQQVESGYQFYQSWIADDFPQVLAVKLQHPTPFFDDSYGINSANNGPYGDAITQELIPYLEKNFRAIGKPGTRTLTGGSTGGWISLAMQVRHPRFFAGAWVLYPDPVDFRRFQLINIYEEDNAFLVPGAPIGSPERMFQRTVEGQPLGSVRQMSQLEAAQGRRGRSAGQLDAWNAAYGPTDPDGYPAELWDKSTGEINHKIAHFWRDNGADLTYYLKSNWNRIGPDLVGKLHIVNPEMDDFYLDLSVYLLEEFLESTTDPYYAGEVFHGRPKKGHGWQPWTNAELIRLMARQMQSK